MRRGAAGIRFINLKVAVATFRLTQGMYQGINRVGGIVESRQLGNRLAQAAGAPQLQRTSGLNEASTDSKAFRLAFARSMGA